LLATAEAQTVNIGGCAIFPGNNVWYSPVDKLPVSPNSAVWVNSIGASAHLFPDFWSNEGGGFLNVVPASQPRVPITIRYASEGDPGPYPIPSDALVQEGSDLHLVVLDQGNCKLYEMFDAVKQTDGSWSVGSAATFDLQSNVQRPSTWTSADAAGTSLLASVVTYDEVMSGQINHAIGMTATHTQQAFVWPATHWASSLSGSQYPPMGARFRLKAAFDVSPYPFEVQVILNALKKYGAIVDDNGAPWFLNGLQDPRWNNNNLHQITEVLGSNMEGVDDSSLMVNVHSAVVAGSPRALDSIYLDQRLVSAGATVNGEVILTAAAPTGGAVVTLASSDAAAVAVPASVTVPAGATSAAFTATVKSIPFTTPVVISGVYESVTRQSPQLLVTGSSGQSPALLSAFALTPDSIVGGTGVVANVTLTAPAPPGGVVVTLTSSKPSAVALPASVLIPGGSDSATVPVQAAPQTASITVNVTASLYADTLTAPLTVTSGTQPTFSTIRINAGGGAYTDPFGNQWSADTAFIGGGTAGTTANIADTVNPALYRTCRSGAFTYQEAVPNGNYIVTLKFAEFQLDGAGKRKFNVALNDYPVLGNFDVFAQAGWLTAIDKSFLMTVANGQIVIQFTAGTAGEPMVSAIEVAPAATASTFVPIRVNASGPTYTDPAGNLWSADTGYSGGNTWITSSAIAGTATPTLYQTCRWGDFTYKFSVPNGNYGVTLKFAEVAQHGASLRQFNVAINGAPVLSNFDIFAQGGWDTAVDRSFPVKVNNGQVVIQFTQGAANWPLISAIDIEQP